MKFTPTDQQRFTVSVLAGTGMMTEQEIAHALGVTKKVLRANFEFELTVGACKRKREMIEATYRLAMEGDTEAAMAFLFP